MLYRFVSIALVAIVLFGCDSDGDEAGVTTDDTSRVATSLDSLTRPSSAARDTATTGPIERPNVTSIEQQRIDKWLTFYADSLNDYGDPKGTMYAGGTPLFNETSGKPVSKYEYIVVKHPERPWDDPLPAKWKKSPEVKKKKVTSIDDDDEPVVKPRRRKKPPTPAAPPAPAADETTPP